MSVIKLKNVSNTNYFFSNIGSVSEGGYSKGKKVGCVDGNNILVTNEDEINKSELMQQLIADKKLVPLEKKKIENNVDEKENEYNDERYSLIAGSEEDEKELREYLESKKSNVSKKDQIESNVIKSEFNVEETNLEPDPKGANGTDLFYKRNPVDIFVDKDKPKTDLFEDFSQNKYDEKKS